MDVAEQVVGSLPIRGRQATWMAALEERHLLADRALGYVELYGAYTETEARYRVDRLLALWDRMDEDDRPTVLPRPGRRRLGPLRPRRSTCPRSSSTPGCAPRPGRSSQPSRADRARKAILSPDRHLAAFDLEHTLIASQRRRLLRLAGLAGTCRPAERAAFVADLLREAPSLLALDRRDRGDFLRSFYRRYEGAPVDRLRGRRLGALPPTCCWPSRSRPASPGSAEHRRPRPPHHPRSPAPSTWWSSPLRPLFDDIVCARLGQADGRFTGRLDELPPIGEARALVLGRLRRGRGPRPRRVDGLRRLGQRPAHAGGGRLPGGRQPRGQAGRHRPAAGLARRALGQGRRRGGAARSPSARSTGAASASAARARRPWPGASAGRPADGRR